MQIRINRNETLLIGFFIDSAFTAECFHSLFWNGVMRLWKMVHTGQLVWV